MKTKKAEDTKEKKQILIIQITKRYLDIVATQ